MEETVEKKEKYVVPPFPIPKIKPQSYNNEVWYDFQIEIENALISKKYKFSNFGRMVCYEKDMFEDGYMLFPRDNGHGYLIYTIYGRRIKYDKRKKKERDYIGRKVFVHKLLAEYFIPKEHEKQSYVVHLDHDRQNNDIRNLKWATPKEARVHNLTNESFAEYWRKSQMKGHKLTADRVKIIKRKLKEGKTRMRILAEQFGVSDTVIEHIKYGKYWKHVTIDDDEPETKPQ